MDFIMAEIRPMNQVCTRGLGVISNKMQKQTNTFICKLYFVTIRDIAR